MVSHSQLSAYSGRVLVLGSDTRSFLAVIRSLGRAGLVIHVAWCPLQSVSLSSKYVSMIHDLPYYRTDDDGWICSFNELTRAYEFDLVVPTDDASLLPLQLHRNRLARCEYIYLLSDEAFQITSNKERTYALAQELEIPLPRQASVGTEDELRRATDEFGFPIFIKPLRSAEPDDPRVRHSVVKVASSEELQRSSTKVLADGAALVQQCFAGIGVGVETLCRKGEVLVAFQHERVHEPLSGGGSSYRKSVHLNPQLLEATRRLMKRMGYNGVCMVEFRLAQDSRRWVLLEINGRFWGSLPLAIAAGCDFPRYLFEMLRHGRSSFNVTYRTDVYSRNWHSDLGFLRSMLRARKTTSSKVSLTVGKLVSGAWNIVRLRERSDTLTMDDPSPAVEEITTLVMKAVVKTISHLRPVRWYMHRRAIRGLRECKSVVFVCKGNICRSPFAKLYFKKLLPNVNILSAGLLPTVGRGSPAPAVEAAASRQVDLSRHRSRLLNEEDFNSDVMLVFDTEQLMAVKRLSKRYRRKVPRIHFVGALGHGNALEIPDPLGGDNQAFADAYDRIASVLASAAKAVIEAGGKGSYVHSDTPVPASSKANA